MIIKYFGHILRNLSVILLHRYFRRIEKAVRRSTNISGIKIYFFGSSVALEALDLISKRSKQDLLCFLKGEGKILAYLWICWKWKTLSIKRALCDFSSNMLIMRTILFILAVLGVTCGLDFLDRITMSQASYVVLPCSMVKIGLEFLAKSALSVSGYMYS